MYIIALAFTIISAVSLIAGFVWILADEGVTRRRRGEEVGADMISKRLAEEQDDSPLFTPASVFKGKASSISVKTSYSFSQIKDLMARGQWRKTIPPLMTMFGLVGLVFFGAVTLMMGLDDKLLGGFLVIAMLMSVGRIVFEFIQA